MESLFLLSSLSIVKARLLLGISTWLEQKQSHANGPGTTFSLVEHSIRVNSHPSSLDEVMRPCQGSDVSIGKDVKHSEFYVCKYSRVSDALLMMFVVADTSIFRPHFFCSPTAHLLMHDGIMNAMIWGINTTPETARQEVFIHIKRAERERRVIVSVVITSFRSDWSRIRNK